MKRKLNLKSRIKELKQAVKSCLPDVKQLSDEQARTILQQYAAAIEPNFTYWMSAAFMSAKTQQGRYAAVENLEVEIRDDHRGMLRNFVTQVDALPDRSAYDAVRPSVYSLHELVSELNGTANLAIMAILENTSAVFIPFLEKVARRLGAKDLTYTKVHGEADIEHAEQFVWAINNELRKDSNYKTNLNLAVKKTEQLLKQIFKYEQNPLTR
jgi:hypothetical protein